MLKAVCATVHERSGASGRSERIFLEATLRGRRGRVGRPPASLHAGSRQVPAAAARRAQPRAACAPHSAAAQQVQEENCQRSGAEPHARDQPRLRDPAARGPGVGHHRDAGAVREADEDHDAAAGHALHLGAVGGAAGGQPRGGRAAPRALALAAVLRPLRVLHGAGAGDALRVRRGLVVSVRLVLRGVRLRLHRPDIRVIVLCGVTAGLFPIRYLLFNSLCHTINY